MSACSPHFRIHLGDVRESLSQLEPASVHTCITSPPYFGLRSYGTPPQIWGGAATCAHEWLSQFVANQNAGGGVTRKQSTNVGSYSADCYQAGGAVPPGKATSQAGQLHISYGRTGEKRDEGGALPRKAEGPRGRASDTCRLCGAWRGELGSEPTVERFVENLCQVFDHVQRVLRDDGLLWVNLGDSYAGSGGAGGDYLPGGLREGQPTYRAAKSSLPAKCLMGVPWRFALAMMDRGWILRSAPHWIKTAPMPESARDRPTTGHEYWFMFAQRGRYYYDMDAVRVAQAASTLKHFKSGVRPASPRELGVSVGSGIAANNTNLTPSAVVPGGRNRRTTDTFYESLDHRIEQQEQYLRHLRKIRDTGGMLEDEDGDPLALPISSANPASSSEHFASYPERLIRPLIACSTKSGDCVLDPFSGTGTTGAAALKMGRSYLGIELNESYAAASLPRLAQAAAQAPLPLESSPESSPDSSPELALLQDLFQSHFSEETL
jgi:hypothetical protein